MMTSRASPPSTAMDVGAPVSLTRVASFWTHRFWTHRFWTRGALVGLDGLFLEKLEDEAARLVDVTGHLSLRPGCVVGGDGFDDPQMLLRAADLIADRRRVPAAQRPDEGVRVAGEPLQEFIARRFRDGRVQLGVQLAEPVAVAGFRALQRLIGQPAQEAVSRWLGVRCRPARGEALKHTADLERVLDVLGRRHDHAGAPIAVGDHQPDALKPEQCLTGGCLAHVELGGEPGLRDPAPGWQVLPDDRVADDTENN